MGKRLDVIKDIAWNIMNNWDFARNTVYGNFGNLGTILKQLEDTGIAKEEILAYRALRGEVDNATLAAAEFTKKIAQSDKIIEGINDRIDALEKKKESLHWYNVIKRGKIDSRIGEEKKSLKLASRYKEMFERSVAEKNGEINANNRLLRKYESVLRNIWQESKTEIEFITKFTISKGAIIQIYGEDVCKAIEGVIKEVQTQGIYGERTVDLKALSARIEGDLGQNGLSAKEKTKRIEAIKKILKLKKAEAIVSIKEQENPQDKSETEKPVQVKDEKPEEKPDEKEEVDDQECDKTIQKKIKDYLSSDLDLRIFFQNGIKPVELETTLQKMQSGLNPKQFLLSLGLINVEWNRIVEENNFKNQNEALNNGNSLCDRIVSDVKVYNFGSLTEEDVHKIIQSGCDVFKHSSQDDWNKANIAELYARGVSSMYMELLNRKSNSNRNHGNVNDTKTIVKYDEREGA